MSSLAFFEYGSMKNEKSKEGLLKVLETLVVVAFGVAYWLYDLHIATAVLVVGMTVFVVLVKLLGEQLTKLQLVSWLAVVILGGAAVFLRDENIIKWKPTVINSLIGMTFLVSHFSKKTLLERVIEEKIPAPPPMLRRVNSFAGVFFLFLAILNVLVFQNFSTNVWVNFKLFGIFVLNLLF